MSTGTSSGPSTTRRLRPVQVAANAAEVPPPPDGTIYMRSPTALEPYPIRLTDRLEHWAAQAPDRVFLAQRPAPVPGQAPDSVTGWRTVTYGAVLEQVRRLAQRSEERRVGKECRSRGSG